MFSKCNDDVMAQKIDYFTYQLLSVTVASMSKPRYVSATAPALEHAVKYAREEGDHHVLS